MSNVHTCYPCDWYSLPYLVFSVLTLTKATYTLTNLNLVPFNTDCTLTSSNSKQLVAWRRFTNQIQAISNFFLVSPWLTTTVYIWRMLFLFCTVRIDHFILKTLLFTTYKRRSTKQVNDLVYIETLSGYLRGERMSVRFLVLGKLKLNMHEWSYLKARPF